MHQRALRDEGSLEKYRVAEMEGQHHSGPEHTFLQVVKSLARHRIRRTKT